MQKQRLGNSTEENTMTDSTYNAMKPDNGVPIKAWTKGVPLEDAARQQLLNVAQLPFIYKWVAATHMSWAHVHAGSTPATPTIFCVFDARHARQS
jgi:tRNA-splicing ligase RtcB (3'-phosphate/5'-hydroxy nucleic acid ligase)